jgi:hypothetical protein
MTSLRNLRSRARGARPRAWAAAVASLLAVAAVTAGLGGPDRPAGAATNDPSDFVGMAPVRLLDTRQPGSPVGKLVGGQVIDITVGGVNGVPTVASGLTSVILNVTVTEPTASGFLTLYPADESRPVVSNVNFVAGQTVPNLTTVKVGSAGGSANKVKLYNFTGSTHVIVDIFGYYTTATPAGRYRGTSAPTRLMDTRESGGAFTSGQTRSLTVVTGGSGAPTGSTAVILNVTVAEPTGTGHLSIFPGSAASTPTISNLNFVPGLVVANLVVVQVPTSGAGTGQIKITNVGGSTHVIVDIVGYYIPNASTNEGRFRAVTPTRTVDTRVCPGAGLPSVPGGAYSLFVLGPTPNDDCPTNPVSPVPSSGVAGLVGNITATQPSSGGYFNVYPSDINRPNTSTINFVPGQTVANLVMVRVPTTGSPGTECTSGNWYGCVAFYNFAGYTHVVADVAGYFTSA